jgi:hypothetical protein
MNGEAALTAHDRDALAAQRYPRRLEMFTDLNSACSTAGS